MDARDEYLEAPAFAVSLGACAAVCGRKGRVTLKRRGRRAEVFVFVLDGEAAEFSERVNAYSRAIGGYWGEEGRGRTVRRSRLGRRGRRRREEEDEEMSSELDILGG